jgi:N-carbamoyl-D-amino-acid hydrolase
MRLGGVHRACTDHVLSPLVYDRSAEVDAWFEREMPSAATLPLFERAKRHGIAFKLGYAELTPDGHRYNTAILVGRDGNPIGKYRKVHLPGHAEFDPARSFQHLEKRYFEPGNLGFPVWRALGGVVGMCICNDRRWPETWRVLGLQGVELVALGFNTPSVNSQKADEGPAQRAFQHRLSMQAGAYQNSTWAVAVAKCGVEDGHPLMGGTMIVDPERRDRRRGQDRGRRDGGRGLRPGRDALRQGDGVRLRPPSAAEHYGRITVADRLRRRRPRNSRGHGFRAARAS